MKIELLIDCNIGSIWFRRKPNLQNVFEINKWINANNTNTNDSLQKQTNHSKRFFRFYFEITIFNRTFFFLREWKKNYFKIKNAKEFEIFMNEALTFEDIDNLYPITFGKIIKTYLHKQN